MLKTFIEFNTPETQDECVDLPCEECSIMHNTLYGDGSVKCLYYDKSMYYIQMQVRESNMQEQETANVS